MSNYPKNLTEVAKEYKLFLEKISYPIDILWVSPNDIIEDGKKVIIKSSESTFEELNDRYLIERGKCGLAISGIGIYKGRVVTTLQIPGVEIDAEHLMIGTENIRYSVRESLKDIFFI